MKLKVLGSGSKGNCYILQGKKESLIIECGVNFKEVKRALNFNLSSVRGCLVTHEHKDHSKAVKEITGAGIDIYLSKGTKDAIKVNGHRIHSVEPMEIFEAGEFKILAFETKHDCKEPLGFLIKHPEMGTMLFATDTYYLEYTFEDLNHILIECNYSDEIINENIEAGHIPLSLKNRVYKSHFSLSNVIGFMGANDLKSVRNIVLLHLSDGNSNAKEFQRAIEECTKKEVFVADEGLEIDISLYPF